MVHVAVGVPQAMRGRRDDLRCAASRNHSQWPGTGLNLCDIVQLCWVRRCRASLEVGLVLLPSFMPALSVLLLLVLRPGISCACVSQRAQALRRGKPRTLPWFSF